MADSNQTRREDFDGITDNDPFAELTRIMGLDPRPSQPAGHEEPTVAAPAVAQESFEDDFAFDLERELTGDFGGDTADAPQAAAVDVDRWASWSDEDAPAQPVEPAPEQSYRDEWAAPAREDAQPEPYAAPVYEPEPYGEPAIAAAQPGDEPSLEFDVEFAQDDFADLDLAASLPESVDPEPESYQATEIRYAGEPEEAYAPSQPEFETADEPADDLDFSALELNLDDAEAGAPEPVATSAYAPLSDEEFHAELRQELTPIDADAAFDDELERELAAPAVQDDFDAELQRELLDIDTRAVAASGGFASEHPEWSVPTGEPSAGWTTDASFGAPNASLEDELSALLADEPMEIEPVGLPPVAAAKPSSAEAWKPAVNTFGRANFPRVEPAQGAQTPPAAAVIEPIAPVEPAPAGDIYAELAAFEPEDLYPQEPEALDQAPLDDFESIFADGLDFGLADEIEASAPVTQADPAAGVFPAAASAPAAFPDLQPDYPEDIAVSQPVLRPAFPAAAISAQQREPAPEIETVEVYETARAVTDDLDIPDLVDYGAEDTPVYDDLEAEITQAFGGLAPDPVVEETTSWNAAPAAAAGFVTAAATAAPAAADTSSEYYAAAQPAQAQWQQSVQYADDPFEYETDLEDAIGMAAYEEAEEPAPKNRRGLLLGGIAAGVVALVGLGFFGMSLFGGGSDGPAVVRADGEPMKVRPENPGGTTVPNQDSQAYETVAGGVSTSAPEQQSLITTTEEPVDVTAQGVTEGTVLPPDVTGAGASELEEVLAEAAKSEDRIVPDTATAEDAIAEEVAAVAPRRVRTMVVRPDGTMVPREEPAAAAPVQEQTTALAPAAGTGAQVPPLGQTLGQTPGLENVQPAEGLLVDDGPVVNTPETVTVVPTPRVEPQAQAQVAAPVVQQPAAPQTPAATPVSAPAAAAPVTAATSEWSMQIASQPSAEGAQQAYQDLARRYGGVLEGRGVNIVRADIQGMGTYYRVRIPASNRDEAIQLCTRYKAAGGSCFVSR